MIKTLLKLIEEEYIVFPDELLLRETSYNRNDLITWLKTPLKFKKKKPPPSVVIVRNRYKRKTKKQCQEMGIDMFTGEWLEKK